MAKHTKQPPVAKAPVGVRQTMAKPVSGYTDPEQLRTLMQNAKRMGREDIWREAFDQLCSLEGAEKDLAGILFVIGAFVGHAQHRKAGKAGAGFGDDIDVLAGL